MTEPDPRRVFLVNKLIDVGLTDEEQAELELLQKQAGHRRRCFRVNQTPPKPYNAVVEPTED